MNLKPQRAANVPVRRRTVGPNPFIEGFPGEPDPNFGTLKESYDAMKSGTDENGGWRNVTVPGEWVKSTISKGPRLGQEVERLSGEAADVEAMLRRAAEQLGLGCSISTVPGPKKGTYTVNYLGTVRRAYTPSVDDDDDDETDE